MRSRERGWAGEIREVGFHRVFAFLSTGADTKSNTRGGGAPERGHGAPLERLAQLGYALGGVGAAAATINAAEMVVGQTAEERRCECQRALTRKLEKAEQRT